MPKALEERLRKRAIGKFPGNKERQDAYTYGMIRKTGWKPGKK